MKTLLIEDDPTAVFLTKRLFHHEGIPDELTTFLSPQKGLDFIRAQLAAGLPPEVILLDLNMPRMNGLEFLEIVRATPELAHLPVFITTTSALDPDREAAARLGVSGYILKPLDFASGDDLADSLSLLEKLLK